MSVEQDLQTILNARYGRDVRQAIHDAIADINDVAVNAEGIADTSRESARVYVQSARDYEQQTLALRNEAEQFRNDAFSATPEGYEEIAGKVNSIVEVTGTDLVLQNTAEGGTVVHKIYGMSVQDGTPTPTNPITIKNADVNFKCIGKNLLEFPKAGGYRPLQPYTSNGITYTIDSEGIITLNGTASSESAITLLNAYNADAAGRLKQGKTYKLSLNVLEGDIDTGNNKSVFIGVVRYDQINAEYNYSVTTLTADPKEWTQSDENTLRYGVRLVVRSGRTVNNVKVRPILTLADDVNYKKYEHTDITTNLKLRAIECESTDNYNLVEGGKYYIADTLQWDEDKGYTITRRVATEIFDGSTDEVISLWNTESAYRSFAILLDKVPVFRNQAAGTIEKWQGLVNSLQPTESAETNIFGRYALQHVRSVEQYRLLVYDAGETPQFANITEFREWLGNNTITINYALAEPYTETLTAQQAQELLKLKTYDGVTSISPVADIAPVLDIEYATNRYTALAFTAHNKAYENAFKIAEINTALLEITSL